MPVFVSILVATLLGILSGLGIGGGSLLLLWLTFVLRLDYPAAKLVNLLFFLPPAFISTAYHLHKKELSVRRILPGAIAGCVSSVAFSIVSSGWNTALLRKLFGILLLATGVREIWMFIKKLRRSQPL